MFLFDTGLFDVMFTIAFVLIIGVIVITIIQGIGEWNKNNNSPRLTVNSKVVSKREEVSHYHDGNNIAMSHMDTTYYVTFEVESGDRIEFEVKGEDFGMMVEGDYGRVSFQGTRFLGFDRMINI